MKITPTTIIVLVVACAASGIAGFYAGQNKSAEAAAAAAASAKHTGAGGKGSSSIGIGGENVTLASLLKGPGKPDAALLAEWAKSLSPKDCADLMAQLQKMKGGALRDTVLEAVIDAWAQKDPQGLIGAVGSLSSPRLRESGLDTALKAWATQDPAAALKWIKDNPGTASTAATQARYDAAIAGFATVDAKGAFDLVSGLSDGNAHDQQIKSQALNALSDSLAEQGRFSDALQLFGALPAGQMHDDAFDHLAENWATSSPADATAWVTTITDPAERARLEGHIADAWAGSDPVAAATWAAQLDQDALANQDPNAKTDPTNGPGMLLANAIVAWSQYDLDGPGQFLNQLPDSPNKDRAVAVFAMHASEEDPEGAVKWIGTVTDPSIRSGVTMVVALQMYQQDPAMFSNFMNTTDLVPDDQKQSLQQIMPMLGPSMAALKSMSGSGGDPMSNIMEGVLTGKSGPLGALMRAQAGRRGGPGAPAVPAPAGP